MRNSLPASAAVTQMYPAPTASPRLRPGGSSSGQRFGSSVPASTRMSAPAESAAPSSVLPSRATGPSKPGYGRLNLRSPVRQSKASIRLGRTVTPVVLDRRVQRVSGVQKVRRLSADVDTARERIGGELETIRSAACGTGLFGSTSPNQRASSPAATEPGWPGTSLGGGHPSRRHLSPESRVASRTAPATATRPEAAITAMRKRRRPGSRPAERVRPRDHHFTVAAGIPPRSPRFEGNPDSRPRRCATIDRWSSGC